MTEPGFEPRSFRCPSKYCNQQATEADGRRGRISAHQLTGTGVWCLCQAAKFEVLLMPFHSAQITGLDVCLRKPIFATCSIDKSVRLWDLDTWCAYLAVCNGYFDCTCVPRQVRGFGQLSYFSRDHSRLDRGPRRSYKITFVDCWSRFFYRLDVLSVNKPTVSKY